MALRRYTVLTYDGIGPYSLEPEPPTEDNTVGTLTEAEWLFRAWLRGSGNDYNRAGGYSGPWADVVLTESWDGISYGDVAGGTGVVRLVRGIRGGIVRERF